MHASLFLNPNCLAHLSLPLFSSTLLLLLLIFLRNPPFFLFLYFFLSFPFSVQSSSDLRLSSLFDFARSEAEVALAGLASVASVGGGALTDGAQEAAWPETGAEAGSSQVERAVQEMKRKMVAITQDDFYARLLAA